MTAKWIEAVTGSLSDKKEYRRLKERQKELPSPYRETAEALERYLMVIGVVDGTTLVDMCRDLIELIEGAAANATPVRDIVGEDPVEFIETFVASYAGRQWIDKERTKLRDAIARADKGAGTT